MTIPTRPVDDAEIETAWGQDVHDRVFAPKGCHVTGSPTAVGPAGPALIPLDTGVDDPGGWLDSALDRLVAPAGSEGLYIIVARLSSAGGVTGSAVRAYLEVNGGEVGRSLEDSQTGVTSTITIPAIVPITAGDLITVHAIKRDATGANPNVGVSALQLVRHGGGYGA